MKSLTRRGRLLLGLFVIASAAAARPAVAAVDLPVAFLVQNVNRSLVPCAADLQTYTVAGRLVAPDDVPSSVSLYLHGLGFGKWFWRFQDVPGLDFAADMAERGHASIVIDRIGYDESGHPIGYLSCLGAQADVAHQIIDQLRAGTYTATGGSPVAFSEVALVGHSAGGATAQVAAYSFGNMDALAVLSYADQGASDLALAAFGGTAVSCLMGGQTDDAGQPTGYAAFGQSDEEFQALMFHDAAPNVVEAATAMRNPDPCGDDASIPAEIVLSTLLLGTFANPVLVLCGKEDAIFPPAACESQQTLYQAADLVLIDGIGHALTLENEAKAFRDALSAWLDEHGF